MKDAINLPVGQKQKISQLKNIIDLPISNKEKHIQFKDTLVLPDGCINKYARLKDNLELPDSNREKYIQLKDTPELPPYTNLDEWEIRDFSEGLVNKVDDNLLPENAAKDCQNFISRYIGSLKKRNGQIRLNSFLDFDNAIYQQDENFELDDGKNFAYNDGGEEFINYLFDRKTTKLDGPIRGLYAYYYDTPVTTRRLVAASNGIIAWWDFQNKQWVNLKTAQKNTDFMFETCVNYMVCFNGLDKPWKWNGTIVSDLENAPVDGQFPIMHKEKLFVVPVTDPSTIYWSESFQPEEWPAVNFWPIKDGDGDKITCLIKHLGELVIFKRRSIHSLRGTSLDDFRLEEMDSRLGCVGPLAAASMGAYLYFISNEGLCVFNGMSVTNLSIGRIPRLWDGINKEYLHKAAVGIWDNTVWFALPGCNSTYNNLIIAYVPEGETARFWPWTGINASCFQMFNNGKEVLFYTGDSSAGFVNQQDIGTDDFGKPIIAYWEGRAFDQGSPEREKRARHIYVQDSPETTNTPTLQVSIDYNDFQALSLRAGNSMVRKYLMPHDASWRYLIPRLSHNQLGQCEVRGLMMPYKISHKPKVNN